MLMKQLGLLALLMTQAAAAADVSVSSTSLSFSLGNGVNLQPSYYCGGEQSLGWAAIARSPRIKAVRIELETQSSADLKDFERWLDEAGESGLSVVATYHQYAHLGSNDKDVLLAAAQWWALNYESLRRSAGSPFFINLMNEWGDHTLTVEQYADAYNDAIAVVRTVYSGFIICDIAGWGQEFMKAANASALIKDQHIVFSAHIYPAAWDSATGAPTAKNIDALAATGRPCMLGEFGSGSSEGAADWSALVDHAKSKGWPVLGWAWNGDGGDMNMVEPSWASAAGCTATDYTTNEYYSTIYDKL